MRGWWLAFGWLAGCGAAGGVDAGGGRDAGGACQGQIEGAPCGDAHICFGGSCVESRCGDRVVDLRTEQCDDGNLAAFDGCTTDCTFTCASTSECDDGNPCNGGELCTAEHVCTVGTPLDEGTLCAATSVTDGVCRMMRCVLRTCGNGAIDPGEDCDDGNDTNGDGCEIDCHPTCADPPPEACNGLDDDCDSRVDEDVAAICFPDVDRDGYAPAGAEPMMVCGLCPAAFTDRPPIDAATTDCDDAQSARHPGMLEICDRIDTDCSSATIDDLSEDADGDGHAPSTATCMGGFLKDDCDDADPRVFPGQFAYYTTPRGDGTYDFDCNGASEPHWPALIICGSGTTCIGGAPGWCTAVPGCGASGTEATDCASTRFGCRVGVCNPRVQECR